MVDKLHHLLMLDAGEEYLIPSEFEIRSFLDGISPILVNQAKNKGLSLRIAIDHALPPNKMYGCSTALAQILNHLVNNAIKFSEQGEIKIEVFAYEMRSPDRIRLQFSVTDNGCGVDQEQIGFILDPFTQVEVYLTRRHAGIGLGLAICLKLVRLLNGRIWVESEIGKGTSFFFTARLAVH